MFLVRVVMASLFAGGMGWWLHEDDQAKPVLPKDTLPGVMDLEAVPGGLFERPVDPADNKTTPKKVRLGRRLFFDPILSENGTVSCASCHQPEHGFASPDRLAVGIGGQKTTRNAPSILNRGYGTHFFWDGRSPSLEQQVLGPLSNPAELGGDIPKVLKALQARPDYVAQFEEAFGESAPPGASVVTVDNLAKAIACFERALLSGNSGVDRFRSGDYSALSREARQGMWIFESRGGCWKCHSGPNLTDEKFHNTGVSFGDVDRDAGRALFTGEEADRFKFKTPSLREIGKTAPYMHDGRMKTLKEVVEFYNKGGAPDDPLLDPKMSKLNLTEDEVGFLVEFLKAMDSRPDQP